MVTPLSNPSFADIDLQELTSYDVSLVKPALLFADKVNLVSYRIDLQATVVSDAFRNSQMPMRYVCAYAALTLRNDEEEIERLGMSRNMLCSREDAEELLTDAPKFLVDFGKKYNDQIAEHQHLVARILRARRDALLSDELDLAVNRNLLECSAWHVDMPSPFDLNWTEVQESFATNAVTDLVHRLATTTGVPLLEPSADLHLRQALGRDQIVQAERHHNALRACPFTGRV